MKEPDRFLAIARIVRPQGRKGEVVADILTDFPARFQTLRQAFLEEGADAPRPVEVEHAWLHKGRVVLKISDVNSIESASRLRGCHVFIPREERTPLPPHSYYLWELEGCQVIAERQGTRREVGTVTEVESTGGVDLLHVATPRGEVLIPLAEEICVNVNLAARRIDVVLPEGLRELNR